jgi:hypothetical protein
MIQWPSTCFRISCGHLQGGNSKNTNILTMFWGHYTVKNNIVLITILVKWYKSDEYKILQVKKLLSGSSSMCRLYYRSPIWIIIHTLTFYLHYSTQSYSRQHFLTSNILYSLLLYHLTRNVINTIWFLTVEWSRHIINIFVFLLLPPWKLPHERMNHVGGHSVITVHS